MAVGKLTRYDVKGGSSLSVIGYFYNAKTGQHIGNGGYSIDIPSAPDTFSVASTLPLPKVPIRATISLSWNNPQPIGLTP